MIGEIQDGNEVVAIGCKGDWIKLQLEDGAEGWALARTGNMELLCPKQEPKKEAPQAEPASAPVASNAGPAQHGAAAAAPAQGPLASTVEARMQSMQDQIDMLRQELRALKSGLLDVCNR